MFRIALAALVLLQLESPGHGAEPDGYLAQLAAAVRARLDTLVASHAPTLVPPTRIAVTWKAVQLGSIDLGAPLVALAAADLDGDKKGELYAVTPRQVIAIGVRNGKPFELGRVAFTGERAVPAPRDVVGTAIVDGGELVAAASPWAKELRVTWRNKLLVAQPGAAPFLVCANERVALEPGRNYFTNATHAVRCRNDLVDAQGHPLHVRAELAKTGKLSVTVKQCGDRTALPSGSVAARTASAACRQVASFEYANVGVAFELADVDRDGTPEVIVSEASAPGAPDSVKVISLGGDDKRGLFRFRRSGGFAGLVTVDADGSGEPEVVAAVRFSGSTKLDLWRLN